MDQNLVNKTLKSQKLIFVINILTLFVLYFLAFYMKTNIITDHVILERYLIIISLGGIPGALKLFHWQSKKLAGSNNLIKYKQTYYTRLFIIDLLFLLNIISLYLTGSNNFSFLAIVIIFALFLCLPSKSQIEDILEPELDLDVDVENKE